MQTTDQASNESFDCNKLIQAFKDDDTEQIERQCRLMPWIGGKEVFPLEMALGEAILSSDFKFAEKIATALLNRRKVDVAVWGRDFKKYRGAEELPFWGQFILYCMTDRYYNRREGTAFFKGLAKLLKDHVFDPWQCGNSAETFIKMIRLGLGSEPTLQFTERGESLTYFVITTNKISIHNKKHILRVMQYRNLFDLNAYNGLPSPAVASFTHRFTSIWNDILSRYRQIHTVHDEHGNNMLYYMFKHKVNHKHIVRMQKVSTIVSMLCEKNKEGKAMVEYSIVNNRYPEWFFIRRQGWDAHYTLSYLVHQELARNNELDVLQRLPPIPDQWLDLYSFLLAMCEFPHNKSRDQYMQTYTGTKRKNTGKVNFVDGSGTTFTFEQLPTEIFEIILKELEPLDVMCLKMTSKVLDMAFNRTRYLSTCFPHSLTTSADSPQLEFSRQVKLDVSWKRLKYHTYEIDGIPYNPRGSVMDEHWIFTNMSHAQWLTNLHTKTVSHTKSYGHALLAILLESGPATMPLVAALISNNLIVMKCAPNGQLSGFKAADLDTSFKYASKDELEYPYIRQLMGKTIVLGTNGAIWNYEIDATIAHLLDSTADVLMIDVHANESLIVGATTAGLSLYDHRTYNRITNITENLTEQQGQLPLRVYIHNNEVVQATSSGLYYYDVRTHKLIDTMQFVKTPALTGAPHYVFDTTGTRCVVNYPQQAYSVIYNIRERGWESGLMTGKHHEAHALNSYAMLMSHSGVVMFE